MRPRRWILRITCWGWAVVDDGGGIGVVVGVGDEGVRERGRGGGAQT